MITLGLAALPNQSLTAVLDGVRYVLTFKTANGCMTASIKRAGVQILSGQRLVANQPIIPYPYLVSAGNFLVTTENDALPDWTQFGATQFLVFATAAEIAGG